MPLAWEQSALGNKKFIVIAIESTSDGAVADIDSCLFNNREKCVKLELSKTVTGWRLYNCYFLC